jgi:HEAT repeat protein
VTALLLLALLQEIDPILDRWSSGDLAERDKATDEVLARWKSWPEGDLAKLEKLASANQGEPSERAAGALRRIRIRRGLGENLVRDVPGIDLLFERAEVPERLRCLAAVALLWKKGGLEDADVTVFAEAAAKAGWRLPPRDMTDLVLRHRVAPLAPLFVELLKSPDPSTLCGALAVLGSLGTKDHARLAAPFLSHASPDVQHAAADALGRLKAVEHAAGVAALLKARDPMTRAVAAVSLGAMKATGYAGDVAALLEDRDLAPRNLAALALGDLGAKDRVGAIASLLTSRDMSSRWSAAASLARLGAVDHAKAILPLLKEPENRSRIEGLMALAVMNATDCIDDVLPLLDDRDGTVRQVAVETLVALGARKSSDRIVALIEDDDRMVQLAAVHALTRLGADPSKLGPLLGSRKILVRSGAVEAIGSRRIRSEAAAVAAMIKDSDPGVSASALYAIARIGGPDHVPVVLEALDHGQEWVRGAACLALAELAGAKERDAVAAKLAPLLRDPDPRPRVTAALALTRLGIADSDTQRKMLDDVIALDEDDWEYLSGEVARALAERHEPEACAALRRDIDLAAPVTSRDGLRSALAQTGLKVETVRIPIQGRFPSGRVPVAVLVEELSNNHEHWVCLPDGGTLRLVTRTEAMRAWRTRLRK